MLIVPRYPMLSLTNKNAVDKSDFVEFSEKITTFVTESIFVDYTMK